KNVRLSESYKSISLEEGTKVTDIILEQMIVETLGVNEFVEDCVDRISERIFTHLKRNHNNFKSLNDFVKDNRNPILNFRNDNRIVEQYGILEINLERLTYKQVPNINVVLGEFLANKTTLNEKFNGCIVHINLDIKS